MKAKSLTARSCRPRWALRFSTTTRTAGWISPSPTRERRASRCGATLRDRKMIAADVDGYGAADLIVTQLNAPPVLLRNVGGNKNHFVRLDLAGFADNKTALGVKVEIFASGHWQKWELAGASGYKTRGPPQILVGLGDAEGIDLLRILWPTGVL